MQSKACLSVFMTLTYSIILVSLPFLTSADIAFCSSSTFNSGFESSLYGELQGDLNGDKIEDIAVANFNLGVVYIILGRRAAFPSNFDLKNATNADGVFKITGEWEFGSLVNPVGDINNDGFDDIIVSYRNGHAVYIFYGKKNWSDLALTSFVSGTHGIKFTNSASFVVGSYGGKAGDVNGDNINDIMIIGNAPFYFCYIIFGKNPMSDLDVANMRTGEGGDGIKIIGSLSFQLGYLGDYDADFNADGYKDIIIGAPMSNKVIVIFGGPGLKNNVTLDSMSTTVGITIYTTSSSFFGYNFANVHDMNGDGIDDLLIGQVDRNRAYLVYGRKNPGNINIDTMTSTDGIHIYKDPADTGSTNRFFGREVQFAGDINQDGNSDAFVSSSLRTYVIYGGSSLNSQSSIIFSATSTQILENSPNDERRDAATTFLADLNGDGVKEFYYSSSYGSLFQLLRGYTTTPGGTCHTCSESCLSCLDANTCTACAQGKTIQGSTCSCTSNQYFSTSMDICTACSTLDPLCTACINENTCTKCSGSMMAVGKNCVLPNCTANQYFNGTACVTCSTLDASCTACSDANTCTKCSEEKNPSGKTCSCAANQYFSGSSCAACSTLDVSCTACTYSNTCTACSDGKKPYGKICFDCSDIENCEKCSSPSVCQQCNVGYFLSNDKCSACPANCKVCTDSSTCQECFADYVLENSACVDDKSLKGWQIALIAVGGAVTLSAIIFIVLKLFVLKSLSSTSKVMAINGVKTFVASNP